VYVKIIASCKGGTFFETQCKRQLNFYFLASCGLIYQNLVQIRVYIAISSSKLLFINFMNNSSAVAEMGNRDRGCVDKQQTAIGGDVAEQ